MKRISTLFLFILSLITALMAVMPAQAQSNIQLIPNDKQTIAGDQAQHNFNTAASLLYGMPFELSFDVTLTGATSESAPSFNEWGSSILTTGTDPFATPQNGIQVYLRCKGNKSGEQLVITANGSAFYFNNVQYNTDNFHVSLIQSNGQMTMEVTNNATITGSHTPKTVTYTKSMMFNQIDKLCYAMPTGMNISKLSMTVNPDDITNYINNIMPHAPGYLTQDARDYFNNRFSVEGDKTTIYRDFINASINGSDVDGKRSYELPEPGKVYRIGNYIKNGDIKNYLTLWENKTAETANLVIKNAFNPSDWLLPNGDHKMDDQDDLYMQNLFSYLWIPRVNESNDAQMTFYHATGLGYSLDYYAGLKKDNPTTWTMEHGLELGYLAMKNTTANKFVAANTAKTGFGAWGTGGMYASGKAQGSNWSTDFFFEEVKGFVPYDLNIIGVTNSDKYEDGGATVDPNTIIAQYQVQPGNYVNITNKGVILVGESSESQLFRDIKTVGVTGKVAVVTIGNGTITIEYTPFTELKDKAQGEINAASTRLTNFAVGALYTQAAIDAANTGIAAAQELFSPTQGGTSDPKAACAKLEETMETFYKTIDGRYITMTNQSNLLSTQSQTNLYAKAKTADEKDNYFGVYQLHYISGGAYQLRNAYENNYVGQTTSAANVNSAATTTAPRWRGTYTLDLKKTGSSTDAYNLVCTNGVANTMLGVSSTNIVKAETTEANKADAANLWDIRLVAVKTYADAYMQDVDPSSMQGTIGIAPSKTVAEALKSAIDNYPQSPTAPQETTLANDVNIYINQKDQITKPAHGQFVTFLNNSASIYLGENLYEMKAASPVDLSCVWETIVDSEGKYYFRNLKSGMFMGKVTKSAIGRLTIKNDGANKQDFDIIAAPGRGNGEVCVALHEMGTRSDYSYIHYSSDRTAIVGWSAGTQGSPLTASQWTITAVSDEDLISYLQTATKNVKSQLNTDITAYKNLGDTPGNYEKSQSVLDEATKAANAEWPTSPTKEQALAAYTAAVGAFNTFTTAGNPMENNEMFLIKTSIAIPDQGSNIAKQIVSQVMLDNNTEAAADGHGSLTNGLQQPTSGESEENKNAFYLFTLWQAVKDGEYYKLYNFYTGYYLSKDISLSNDAQGRFGLTTDPEEAASFIIKPQHGCFVTFHRSDYDEQNDGYLYMQTNNSGARTMFGLSSNNITTTGDTYHQGRMLFELEPATTEHYERCLKDMLDYPIGTGIGKYTDLFAGETKNYTSEKEIVQDIFKNKDNKEIYPTEDDYKTALQNAAKDFAPILAGLRINLPEAGKYYRIYNIDNSTRYYISKGTTPGTNFMSMATLTEESAHNDINSVFYFDGTYLLTYGNGYYIGGWAPWVQGSLVGDEHQKWAMTFANTGYTGKGKYSIKPLGRSYLYNNKTSGLNGWSAAFNALCEWTLEEVTELPVKLNNDNGIYYATLVSARNHRIPSGLDCYYAIAAGNSNVSMKRITDGILPANVPVLLRSKTSNVYCFTETDNNDIIDATQYEGNLFSGELETQYSGFHNTGTTSEYTFQKPSGNSVGFYLYNGQLLNGFRIYLSKDKITNLTGSKPTSLSFIFEDEDNITGINEMGDKGSFVDYNNLFDLTGRKVNAHGRGMYISKGKKYIINK